MESNLCDAIGHINIECGLLGVKGTSKWCEYAHDRLALTPSHMIRLAIGYGERATIATPADTRNTIVVIKGARALAAHLGATGSRSLGSRAL